MLNRNYLIKSNLKYGNNWKAILFSKKCLLVKVLLIQNLLNWNGSVKWLIWKGKMVCHPDRTGNNLLVVIWLCYLVWQVKYKNIRFLKWIWKIYLWLHHLLLKTTTIVIILVKWLFNLLAPNLWALLMLVRVLV